MELKIFRDTLPQAGASCTVKLRCENGLPDGTAAVQAALQLRKLTGSFFRERHRANKFFRNAENGCGKPLKILWRIIRCKHQHQITRVGVLALDLCSTQLFSKLCSGKSQNRSIQRDLEWFAFQCQRPRFAAARCRLQSWQMLCRVWRSRAKGPLASTSPVRIHGCTGTSPLCCNRYAPCRTSGWHWLRSGQ